MKGLVIGVLTFFLLAQIGVANSKFVSDFFEADKCRDVENRNSLIEFIGMSKNIRVNYGENEISIINEKIFTYAIQGTVFSYYFNKSGKYIKCTRKKFYRMK
jgi:hypothetical protein